MSETAMKLGRSYFLPDGISGELFRLTGAAKSTQDRSNAFDQLFHYINKYRGNFLGYQSTAMLEPAQELTQLLSTALNNIGDSFASPEATGKLSQLADGYFSLNAKWIERAVLDYFAERWHAGAPRRVREDKDGSDEWQRSYWGYVLSMGATEGNLMALRSARDYLKGRHLLFDAAGSRFGARLHYEEGEHRGKSEFNPVLLYSRASHYSIRKLAQMLEFESQEIDIDEHGRIDLDDLLTVAKHILHEERRPLAVSFNYGTTWTGALDDLELAIERLKPELQKAGMDTRTVWHGRRPCERRGFWFHVDGALGAGYGTYVDTDRDEMDHDFKLPCFDFRNDIQSIVMSGHKWPGAPWPTGIYMTQNRYMLTNDVPTYVGSLDSTLAGSRSGVASIFLWDWLSKNSDEERKQQVSDALELARHAHQEIKKVWDTMARRAPGSLMVVFKEPTDELVRKYGLARSGDKVHLVCMRHVRRELIDALVKDLKLLNEVSEMPLDGAQFQAPVREAAASYVPSFDDSPREG